MKNDQDSRQTQAIQEKEYVFPYHHLVQRKPDIELFRSWPGGLTYLFTQDLIMSKLRSLDFESLIDIGCGDGKIAMEILKEFPGKTVCGVDYSHKAIAWAQLLEPQINFYAQDISQQQLEKQFDIGCLVEVIEHIPTTDLPEFLRAVASTIKNNGHLIVTVPHRNAPKPRKHFQHFTKQSLANAMSERFTLKEMLHINKKPSTYTRWLMRVLRNRFCMVTHPSITKLLYNKLRSHLQISTEDKANGLLGVFQKI